VTISDFIWQVAVILVFGVSGAAVCRARLEGQSAENFQALLGKTRHLYLVFPLLLVFPFINVYLARNPSLQWDMPPWLQLHWAALSWGIVSALLAYVFGFCSVVGLTTGHQWRWGLVYFGVAVLAAIQVYAGWSSRLNLPPLGETRISSDGVILQTTPYTCVPAAAANIAAMLGVHATEKELVVLFHTTRDGTFPAQVLRGLKELGISGRKVASDSALSAIHPPAMLFVFADSHAVVYAGMTGGLAEIWNPSAGKAFLPAWRLHQMWDGHALEFERARN
jgi:hypothetical protein